MLQDTKYNNSKEMRATSVPSPSRFSNVSGISAWLPAWTQEGMQQTNGNNSSTCWFTSTRWLLCQEPLHPPGEATHIEERTSTLCCKGEQSCFPRKWPDLSSKVIAVTLSVLFLAFSLAKNSKKSLAFLL